ncbi:MAG TPA: hypothetical protein PKA16_04465 [Ottowia sp.]|uniref:hypothetical protein n=1 Tax=Ottowia sp. TaxID=1898956 RepID=UPI002C293CD0|nr:hypothetical protein [Ottowia sp.]HMN20629.1 hypothetical protein [Ottowia sp.]
MYEIWLMLNIVWELALGIWPWLLALAIVWLLLMARAWGRGAAAWRASLPGAIGLGLAVAIVIFFVTPSWIGSSLTELKYWVDWANLLGIAAGWGAAGLAFAWPLLTGLRRRARPF